MKNTRKKDDKNYLENKKKRGWVRLWIPPELVELVKKLIAKSK